MDAQPGSKESQLRVVDKIVSHVKQTEQTMYVVRWYGYTPADGTIEPAHLLP